MSTSTSTETTPTRFTLERAPERALIFLLAVGRWPAIRGLLEARGYSAEEHELGWKLLRAVDPTAAAGHASGAGGGSGDGSAAVREALAKLDRWDNDHLPIADVALKRRVPTVHALLFAGGLAPVEGVMSVTVVRTFLDRLDALDGVRRGAKHATVSRADATAALKVLTTRGLDDGERKAARQWLATVETGAGASAPAAPDDDAARVEALLALHEWRHEWATVARKVVTRRDYRIALGIAERGARRSDAKDGAEKKTKKSAEKKPDDTPAER